MLSLQLVTLATIGQTNYKLKINYIACLSSCFELTNSYSKLPKGNLHLLKHKNSCIYNTVLNIYETKLLSILMNNIYCVSLQS